MNTKVFNILLGDLLVKFINTECQLKDNDIQYENKTIYTFKENEKETRKISFTNKEHIETSCKILNIFRTKNVVPTIVKDIELCLGTVITHNNFRNMNKEIAAIKESQQNTSDIVNLFTDVDKNRTNTDEEIKKVNNRLNKVESTLEQILALLQKS